MVPWILCGLLVGTVIILSLKIAVMRRSVREITEQLSEVLSAETNRLLYVSSGDKHVRALAVGISRELAELRRLRLRYLCGDRELREAVTNISHDLRTPLTAICGYLDLLEGEETSENAQRYIAHIKNRAQALTLLTEELFRYLFISSTPEMCEEKTDIRALLETSLVSFYAELELRGITPVINLPDREVVKKLDSSALSRIFGNIIGNAVKYSDGDLSVSMDADGRIVFANSSAQLSKVDVGRLFDKFFTVDNARKSTGLGLSIAKLLTERMGGSICAEYKNGKLFITVSF